jgi:hypothetical protein
MMATKQPTRQGDEKRDSEETPPVREEYPGPQTASTGEHIEPGDVKPSSPRHRDGQQP